MKHSPLKVLCRQQGYVQSCNISTADFKAFSLSSFFIFIKAIMRNRPARTCFARKWSSMSILELLGREETWAEYRDYKSAHSHMSNRELEELDRFIAEKRYTPVTDCMTQPGHGFSYPLRRVINKSGTRKKRVIYTFPEDETRVLKLLTWLLYRYDAKLSDSCFSFRRKVTAKDAVYRILQLPKLKERYGLKLDIHNYFNSMPVPVMTEVLSEVIDDDEPLRQLLSDLLSEGKAIVDGELTEEEHGAMAGVPISAFMANFFLKSLDTEFEQLGIPYFRYSDDILIFADSEEERQMCRELVEKRMAEKGLTLNPDKYALYNPGESWEFLGFAYRGGRIDLSHVTIEKMKAKIKRKCRAIYRWRVRKDVDFDHAAKACINVFNRKFYDVDEEEDFTWSRWFFPVLTTDEGLHALDEYLVSELRYLATGRHYKGNYRITYEHLKELGFRSLVNEFYKFKQTEA